MNIWVSVLSVVIFPALLCAEEHSSAIPDKKLNPHAGKGNCQVCHVETEESLNAWSFFGSAKRRMKADHNAVCMQCHGMEFGHGVGKPPKANVDNLPLDEHGNIACALTCHSMHVKTNDQSQTYYHLRLPNNRICESCHPKDR